MSTEWAGVRLENSYASLPQQFYSLQAPTPVREPALIALNESLAQQLGLDAEALVAAAGVEVLAGNRIPQGATPLAMAYAGHQFGGWASQLGDGRAVLLGEVVASSQRFDIQLKGAGRTPYSRMGDGRAWLGPVLREYLVSEAMHALGIPTTRALAAVATGESVLREGAMPGAILVRVARGHVRVGTFEYFASRRDTAALTALTRYVYDRAGFHSDSSADRHQQNEKPQASGASATDSATDATPALALLQAVVRLQADLVAQWQSVGFIHGVMNTDNMSVFGETIDYGPCAFMDAYRDDQVFSSIDRMGRYAYSNQPRIAQWNLAMLAQSLLPIIDADADHALEQAQATIDGYPQLYDDAWKGYMRGKLGLFEAHEADQQLAVDLLALMGDAEADFTNTFDELTRLGAADTSADAQWLEAFNDTTAGTAWLHRWRTRLREEKSDNVSRTRLMRQHNPAVIPRNHRIEAAIQAGVEGDFGPFAELHRVLCRPGHLESADRHYRQPPTSAEIVTQTFCGT